MKPIFLSIAVSAALVLSGCQTTGGSVESNAAQDSSSNVEQSAAVAAGNIPVGTFSGNYESGSTWSVKLRPDGSAIYTDAAEWMGNTSVQPGEVIVKLPSNYEWDGIRYDQVQIALRFDEAGKCTGMTFTNRTLFSSGKSVFPATCSGRLDS